MNSRGSILTIIVVVMLYAGLIALGFWLTYLVIHKAIARGLRTHQLWLEERSGGVLQ